MSKKYVLKTSFYDKIINKQFFEITFEFYNMCIYQKLVFDCEYLFTDYIIIILLVNYQAC